MGHPGPAGCGEMCCREKGEGPVVQVAWRRRSTCHWVRVRLVLAMPPVPLRKPRGGRGLGCCLRARAPSLPFSLKKRSDTIPSQRSSFSPYSKTFNPSLKSLLCVGSVVVPTAPETVPGPGGSRCSCLRDDPVPSSVSATCFYSPSLGVPSRSETSRLHSGPPETGDCRSVSASRCPSATPPWAGAALRDEARLHGGQSRKPVSDSAGTPWQPRLLPGRALSPFSGACGAGPCGGMARKEGCWQQSLPGALLGPASLTPRL